MHNRLNAFMTDEQVPRSGPDEPIHSELIDELDRIREVRKASAREAKLHRAKKKL